MDKVELKTKRQFCQTVIMASVDNLTPKITAE